MFRIGVVPELIFVEQDLAKVFEH